MLVRNMEGAEKMRAQRVEVQEKASEEWGAARAVRETGVETRGTQVG